MSMSEPPHLLKFVRALPADVARLRGLSRESEAHWGYDRAFLEQFDRAFNITEAFIRENPVYAAWDGARPMGFWGLKEGGGGWELEYFYIAKPLLSRGYGAQLWGNMAAWCKTHGIADIHFVTSPQAVGFYEKMGAVQDGISGSAIDGRPIPHFHCRFSE